MPARSYRRFLILSSPRSGTHLLRSALAQHPAIVALTEMFNPDWTRGAPFNQDTPDEVILREHIFRDYPPGVRAVGFALHRSGARFGNWPGLWARLESDSDLRVISLSRLNLLRRYLSWRTMREPKSHPPEPKRMTAEELREEFLRQETLVAAFDQRFASHPLLRVNYEELDQHPDATLARAQQFLGVEPLPLAPTTARNPLRPLSERIAGFDELAAQFAGSRWEWFFARAPTFSSAVEVTV